MFAGTVQNSVASTSSSSAGGVEVELLGGSMDGSVSQARKRAYEPLDEISSRCYFNLPEELKMLKDVPEPLPNGDVLKVLVLEREKMDFGSLANVEPEHLFQHTRSEDGRMGKSDYSYCRVVDKDLNDLLPERQICPLAPRKKSDTS
jgi:hypothetical protein